MSLDDKDSFGEEEVANDSASKNEEIGIVSRWFHNSGIGYVRYSPDGFEVCKIVWIGNSWQVWLPKNGDLAAGLRSYCILKVEKNGRSEEQARLVAMKTCDTVLHNILGINPAWEDYRKRILLH